MNIFRLYCNFCIFEEKCGYGVIFNFGGVFDILECDYLNEVYYIFGVGVVDY